MQYLPNKCDLRKLQAVLLRPEEFFSLWYLGGHLPVHLLPSYISTVCGEVELAGPFSHMMSGQQNSEQAGVAVLLLEGKNKWAWSQLGR